MTVEGDRLRSATGVPVHFVVPAAGSGSRFGGELPKQFRDIAGRPMLFWTVARLLRAGAESVVLALPEETLRNPPGWLGGAQKVRCVAGGSTRQASVALALDASAAAAGDLVAVHDGARPAVAFSDLFAVCAAASGGDVDGAILGRSVSDTLKRVAGGRISDTVERSGLFRAETPQVFRRSILERAISQAAASRFVGTDEASLVERIPGTRIAAVEAEQANPKVTTPADLVVVEALLATFGDPEEVKEWR